MRNKGNGVLKCRGVVMYSVYLNKGMVVLNTCRFLLHGVEAVIITKEFKVKF